MQTFVINLASRPDRLAFMERQLNNLGVAFSRIDAVNGLGDADIGYPAGHTRLTKGEFACYLSHVLVWQKLVASTDNHCLVLEDDVVLSPNFRSILETEAFFTHKLATTRLETYPHRISLAFKPMVTSGGFALHESREYRGSSGAYVIHRDFATYLLSHHKVPRLPVDEILFHPKRTSFANNTPAQLVPAVCYQQECFPHWSAAVPTLSSDLTQGRQGKPDAPEKGQMRRQLAKALSYPFTHLIRIGPLGRIRLHVPMDGIG